MATKRRKVRKSRRRSCKHGKLKRPIRTRKGGKRRCKKIKSKKKSRKSVKKDLNKKDWLELLKRRKMSCINSV